MYKRTQLLEKIIDITGINRFDITIDKQQHYFFYKNKVFDTLYFLLSFFKKEDYYEKLYILLNKKEKNIEDERMSIFTNFMLEYDAFIGKLIVKQKETYGLIENDYYIDGDPDKKIPRLSKLVLQKNNSDHVVGCFLVTPNGVIIKQIKAFGILGLPINYNPTKNKTIHVFMYESKIRLTSLSSQSMSFMFIEDFNIFYTIMRECLQKNKYNIVFKTKKEISPMYLINKGIDFKLLFFEEHLISNIPLLKWITLFPFTSTEFTKFKYLMQSINIENVVSADFVESFIRFKKKLHFLITIQKENNLNENFLTLVLPKEVFYKKAKFLADHFFNVKKTNGSLKIRSSQLKIYKTITDKNIRSIVEKIVDEMSKTEIYKEIMLKTNNNKYEIKNALEYYLMEKLEKSQTYFYLNTKTRFHYIGENKALVYNKDFKYLTFNHYITKKNNIWFNSLQKNIYINYSEKELRESFKLLKRLIEMLVKKDSFAPIKLSRLLITAPTMSLFGVKSREKVYFTRDSIYSKFLKLLKTESFVDYYFMGIPFDVVNNHKSGVIKIGPYTKQKIADYKNILSQFKKISEIGALQKLQLSLLQSIIISTTNKEYDSVSWGREINNSWRELLNKLQ